MTSFSLNLLTVQFNVILGFIREKKNCGLNPSKDTVIYIPLSRPCACTYHCALLSSGRGNSFVCLALVKKLRLELCLGRQ